MVKRIIPAVASTNAVIAALCAMETFKVTTNVANPLNNYLMFNQGDQIYTYQFEAQKDEHCLACSRKWVPILNLSHLMDHFLNLIRIHYKQQCFFPFQTPTSEDEEE